MTNKERLELNNAKIEEITKTLARKQVSPTDMLQARVDTQKSCIYLFAYYSGESLDFINQLNVNGITSMKSMFYNCYNLKNLDLSFLDTSKVTDMEGMFSSCVKLESLDVSNFDTTNVTNMGNMFGDNQVITILDLSSFDTSNVTKMSSMFSNCKKLETILGTLDMIKTSYSPGFNNCANLTNLTLKNIKEGLTLGSGTSYGTLLSNESLINTFKELWDNTNNALGGSRTLKLSTTSKENIANTYVKLVDVTDEMLAQDQYAGNKKPCVVCESTDDGAMTLTEYLISKNWSLA